MIRRFKTITIFDMDVETGKSKIVQHYTTQLGDNTKLVYKPKAKPKPKEPETIVSEQPTEVEF